MFETLAQLFAEEIKKVSGCDTENLRAISFSNIPQTPEFWCILLNVSGYTEGFLAITLSPKLGFLLSHAILKKTLGDFPEENLDDTLSQNTVGELGNMALGELFRRARQEKKSYIAAPRYSTRKAEEKPLQTADFHFALDLFGDSCYLSWRLHV